MTKDEGETGEVKEVVIGPVPIHPSGTELADPDSEELHNESLGLR